MCMMPTQVPLKIKDFAHPARNVNLLGIQPGMKVADFGSGSGAYVLAIAETLGGSGHVYAIDVQRDLLRRIKNEAARRGYKNVEVLWSDLESSGGSKLADGGVDFVLISNLLFQIRDIKNVLAEGWRVLAARGRIAIIDWSDSFRGMGPPDRDVVPREKAISLAEGCGFEFLKEFPAGAHHYGVIFKKSL